MAPERFQTPAEFRWSFIYPPEQPACRCQREPWTYLSSPWRPAALFDLPNHGGHEEQGQEAAVDRQEVKETIKKGRKRWINVKEKSKSVWGLLCIKEVHDCRAQTDQWFSLHIHVCFGLTVFDRSADYICLCH